MIRQGSILRLTGFDQLSDIRFQVLRLDRETDLYHLQSIRALHDFTIERCILHAWVRSKRLALVAQDRPTNKPAR